MNELMELLELTTAKSGNFSLEWNPQRSCYDTVAEHIQDNDGFCDDFESDEMRQRAIDEDSLVVLQWYPNTPVGFNVYAAPDMESLARWVIESVNTTRATPRSPVKCTVCELPKAARYSHIAELGGNPNWCWSGCSGYDSAPAPVEIAQNEVDQEESNDVPREDASASTSGNEQSFGFQCSKCGTSCTYMERGTLGVTVDQAAEWMGMVMVNGYPQCSDDCN